MASLGEVAKTISAACDKASLCRDSLGVAQDLAEEAHALLANALVGVDYLESDTAQMLAEFVEVTTGVATLWRILGKGLDYANAALAEILGSGAPTSPPIASRRVRTPNSATGETDRVERLRRELPPPVAPSSGQKTHGRWIAPDGTVQSIVSGRDDKFKEAIRVFKEMKARRIPSRASDVEMKLAAHMRQNGISSATLVINHVPCEGPLGCDELVPVILPQGSTLTVYGAGGFVRRYEGGKTSEWLP